MFWPEFIVGEEGALHNWIILFWFCYDVLHWFSHLTLCSSNNMSNISSLMCSMLSSIAIKDIHCRTISALEAKFKPDPKCPSKMLEILKWVYYVFEQHWVMFQKIHLMKCTYRNTNEVRKRWAITTSAYTDLDAKSNFHERFWLVGRSIMF